MKRGYYVLIALLTVNGFLFFKGKRTKRDLTAELEAKNEQLNNIQYEYDAITEKYQIEETEKCLDLTKDIILAKARLEQLLEEKRAKKNEVCGLLDSPTDRVKNPQKYFVTTVDENGEIVFK